MSHHHLSLVCAVCALALQSATASGQDTTTQEPSEVLRQRGATAIGHFETPRSRPWGFLVEVVRVGKPHPSGWAAPMPTDTLERVGRKFLFRIP